MPLACKVSAQVCVSPRSSAAPLFDDVDGIVQRLQADLDWCDAQGVQLAVFPECYLQGYASDRETVARRALELEGEAFAAILRRLALYTTTLILGLSELRRAESCAALYNTAAVIQQGRFARPLCQDPSKRGSFFSR